MSIFPKKDALPCACRLLGKSELNMAMLKGLTRRKVELGTAVDGNDNLMFIKAISIKYDLTG